ncbi:hypothetical protein CFP65_2371 [Kitasatospora sp. MMS16-BH015]|uniref:hypothetical protein n=1 Tax=Kitasatospora sp. MMS16-BH015 TaxID=2018025 RepID=UPI000CA25B7A|nr:hypothetical protein [Kitasatospora sp. MMS16-BH015]AUG77205.1 hypothetical protein CFP65_2371 [Kitasatospora sp. MMS16-BH015]
MTGEQERPVGCLVGVLRAVALVVVVPVRFGWELALVVLRPVGAVIGWAGRLLGAVLEALVVRPLAWVWRRAVVPVALALGRGLAALGRGIALAARAGVAGVRWLGAHLVVLPLGWLWRAALRPVGRGVSAAMVWAVGYLVVAPLVWVVTHLVVRPLIWFGKAVLLPVGRAVARAGRRLVLAPLAWLGRVSAAALVRVGRVVGRALAAVGRVAWAGLVRVGRGIVWVWRVLLRPVARVLLGVLTWAWRTAGRIWRYLVVRPCRWVRREVWWPVKLEVRRVTGELRRALLG